MNVVLERPIRKFNPGTLQSDEEVISQFVVRQRELDIVLEVLRGNIASPSCQHMLLVAPRGRGKTMLLARVGAELRAKNALSSHLFPVRFMEESQEIHTLADFWLEALFYTANANAATNPELCRELRATHATLTARWRDTHIQDYARAAVLEAADRMNRKLVLMVENLQALWDDVKNDDFGWQLRQTLQSDPKVVLLATATSRLRGLDDAKHPFFEMLRIIELAPLDTDECRHLWNVVTGDQRTNREITPLRILTGGSPRLIIIVATFARHRSLRQLLEDLVTLVDDHTEYFRSYLDGLAKIERRVFLSVVDLWRPSSANEIAARARMDIRKVSALLARLVDRGAVLVYGLAGRRQKYVAAEGIYSIYYKLRRERDEAEVVRNLIVFMTAFYGYAELAAMVNTWRVEAAQSPLAIREELDVLATQFRANDPVDATMMGGPLVASDGADRDRRAAQVLFSTGVAHGRRGDQAAALAAYGGLVDRFGDSATPELQVQVAKALFNKGIMHDQRGEYGAELAAYDDIIDRFGDSAAPELQVQVAKALFGMGAIHGRRGKRGAAMAAYNKLITRFGDNRALEVQMAVAKALFNKGGVHVKRRQHKAAIGAYTALVARFGDSVAPDLQVGVAKALFNKGVIHGQRGERELELGTYNNLCARFGEAGSPELQLLVAKALFNKSIMHDQAGEHEAELAAYEDLITRFGDSGSLEVQAGVAKALFNKGITHSQRGEYEAAVAAYEDLDRRFGDSDSAELRVEVARALLGKGIALGESGDHAAELVVYDGLVARFGDEDGSEFHVAVSRALVNKIAAHGQRGEYEAGVATADTVVGRFGDSDVPALQLQVANALLNKGVVHDRRAEREAEVATYDDVVARFGDADAAELQLRVAEALVNKGVTCAQAGEHQGALATYDDVVRRFGDADALELQLQVAEALLNKGVTHADAGEHEEAVAAYDDVVRRFRDDSTPDGRQVVGRALVGRGEQEIASGRAERALNTSEELGRFFAAGGGDDASRSVGMWQWRAEWMKAHALVVQKDRAAAMDAFRVVCAMFVAGNETMVREMLVRVPGLIGAGLAEREVVQVLTADANTASALAPLIVALQLRAGEPVRASAEVLEVAADVGKEIEETRLRMTS